MEKRLSHSFLFLLPSLKLNMSLNGWEREGNKIIKKFWFATMTNLLIKKFSLKIKIKIFTFLWNLLKNFWQFLQIYTFKLAKMLMRFIITDSKKKLKMRKSGIQKKKDKNEDRWHQLFFPFIFTSRRSES